MADRIVYLLGELPESHQGHTQFINAQLLQEILDQGYEVAQTVPGQTVSIDGNQQQAIMMILRPAGENRGLVVQDFDPDGSSKSTQGGGRALHVVMEVVERMTKALARGNSAGHLGAPADHSFPGLTIISGEVVAKAMDAGMIARAMGQEREACPFPSGSAAAQQWLRGWMSGAAAHDVTPAQLDRARDQGRQEALLFKDIPDVEVHCPYLPRTPLHVAWVEGFMEGGGTVV
jgi:ribosome modulation factor